VLGLRPGLSKNDSDHLGTLLCALEMSIKGHLAPERSLLAKLKLVLGEAEIGDALAHRAHPRPIDSKRRDFRNENQREGDVVGALMRIQ